MSRLSKIVLAADVIVAAVFVFAGRSSHHSDGNYFVTAWPFLTAVLVAWLAPWVWSKPFSASAFVTVWTTTAAGGLLLRWVSGGSVSWPFPVVTAAFLAIGFLVVRVAIWAATRNRTSE